MLKNELDVVFYLFKRPSLRESKKVETVGSPNWMKFSGYTSEASKSKKNALKFFSLSFWRTPPEKVNFLIMIPYWSCNISFDAQFHAE